MTTSAQPEDQEVYGTNLHALRTGDGKPYPLSGTDLGDGTLALNVNANITGGGSSLEVNGASNVTPSNPMPAVLEAGSASIGLIANTAFGISGTLPAFAATPTVNVGTLPALSAGTNAIGQVGGKSTTVDVTPTITPSSAYTAGYEVGGLLTFSNALSTAGTGILQSITIKIKSTHSEGFKLYIFKANPSNTTWTDKTQPAINAADLPSLVGMYPLTVSDNGLGSMSIYNLDGIGKVLNPGATTLYGVLVTTSTPTFSSNSDITVSIGVLQD